MRALLLTVALCACTAAETLEPPTGATYKFVLSDYVRPSVWADLPPRGSNTLDFAFSWLAHVGFDAGAGAREIMQRGDILLLAELQVPEATDVLANPTASVSMFSGANPQPPPCSTMEDTVCGDHLEGDAHSTSRRR